MRYFTSSTLALFLFSVLPSYHAVSSSLPSQPSILMFCLTLVHSNGNQGEDCNLWNSKPNKLFPPLSGLLEYLSQWWEAGSYSLYIVLDLKKKTNEAMGCGFQIALELSIAKSDWLEKKHRGQLGFLPAQHVTFCLYQLFGNYAFYYGNGMHNK